MPCSTACPNYYNTQSVSFKHNPLSHTILIQNYQSIMQRQSQSDLEETIPVRESCSKYRTATINSEHIHYVTLPLRLTLSTSPSASQTRPLQVQLNQIQNYQFIPPQVHQIPFDKIKRNKIFGNERDQDFTPRRKIYVESKYSVNLLDSKRSVGDRDGGVGQGDVRGGEEKKSQWGREREREIKEAERRQEGLREYGVGEVQEGEMGQRDDDTNQQIKEELAGMAYQPMIMIQNRYSQSYNSPFYKHIGEDGGFQQQMSMQIKSNGELVAQLDFSPIPAQNRIIPMQQDLFFNSPTHQQPQPPQSPLIHHTPPSLPSPSARQFTSTSTQTDKHQLPPSLFPMLLFLLLLSHLIFQIIK